MKIELTDEELQIILNSLNHTITTVNSYKSLVNKTKEVTSIELLFNKLSSYENYR